MSPPGEYRSAQPEGTPMSELQRDLVGVERDARYRAMTFIASYGGPAVAAAPDDAEGLAARSEVMQRWLAEQPDPAALDEAYSRYVKYWSPVFKD